MTKKFLSICHTPYFPPVRKTGSHNESLEKGKTYQVIDFGNDSYAVYLNNEWVKGFNNSHISTHLYSIEEMRDIKINQIINK